MRYRLVLEIEADEPGILRARKQIRELLEPEHGHIGTITVEGWVWDSHAKVPAPLEFPHPYRTVG